MHGALLCKALARLDPQARFTGMGGPALAEAGFQTQFSTSELSVMGFTEVFSRLPHILDLLGRIKKMLRKRRPKAVILIDAPDFNFFVAPHGPQTPHPGLLLHLAPGLGLAHGQSQISEKIRAPGAVHPSL